MISKIPTPNAIVDTSLWPVVKVALAQSPTEDEYRVCIGKLRLLRARGASHFIVVDATKVNEIPDRAMRERVAAFVNESMELETGAPVGVAVVATSDMAALAARAIFRACGHAESDVLLFRTPGAALARAKVVLGAQTPSLLRTP